MTDQIPPRKSKAPAHRWNAGELPGHTYFAMVHPDGSRLPECFCGWRSDRYVRSHRAAAMLFTMHISAVMNGDGDTDGTSGADLFGAGEQEGDDEW